MWSFCFELVVQPSRSSKPYYWCMAGLCPAYKFVTKCQVLLLSISHMYKASHVQASALSTKMSSFLPIKTRCWCNAQDTWGQIRHLAWISSIGATSVKDAATNTKRKKRDTYRMLYANIWHHLKKNTQVSAHLLIWCSMERHRIKLYPYTTGLLERPPDGTGVQISHEWTVQFHLCFCGCFPG